MRDYGKVYTRFWLKQNVLSWSDSAKLLSLYLLTCPHCNLLGCFRLPGGYVASDLGWSEEQVQVVMSELAADGFIVRCENSGWTLITSFLRNNPIENPNQGKAAVRLLRDVPGDFIGMKALLEALSLFVARLPDEFAVLFRSEDKPVRNSHSSDDNESNNQATVGTVTNKQFDDFWELQIRKEKKAKAKEEWLRLGLHENQALANEVIRVWQEQREFRLQYQDRTKTPMPHNWLLNRQWEDEYVRTDEAPKGVVRGPPLRNAQLSIEESNRRIAQSWAGPELKEVKTHAGNG